MLETVQSLLQDLAPEITTSLQSPAPAAKIKELEQLVGQPLPKEYIQLYRECNGIAIEAMTNFAYGFEFIDIERGIDAVQHCPQPHDSSPLSYADNAIHGDYTFSRSRIPIGDDRGSCLICVDLEPSSSGMVGQVILLAYEDRVALKLADSVDAYIQNFAQDLADGKYSVEAAIAQDTAPRLIPAAEIDLCNWFHSPTWSHVPLSQLYVPPVANLDDSTSLNNLTDAELLEHFQILTQGLCMYSEAEYPYDVFLWEVAKNGELLDSLDIFHFMKVLEVFHGSKQPIRKSSLLQKKHLKYFEFNHDKLTNKNRSSFYKKNYDAWNRFVGRIYTDNGALHPEEIKKMRVLAAQIWRLQENSVRVFEFGRPTIEHYAMGRTPSGNWLGIHTSSVET